MNLHIGPSCCNIMARRAKYIMITIGRGMSSKNIFDSQVIAISDFTFLKPYGSSILEKFKMR